MKNQLNLISKFHITYDHHHRKQKFIYLLINAKFFEVMQRMKYYVISLEKDKGPEESGPRVNPISYEKP
ncbi:hypothetical protein A4D02_01460 [Niastella koreensis]|uniref:Uncharacterized protein n=2 Tax=Niastella koreensis TaxID=354356 RepID=G8TF45_NIAKG|nr:hypothetical protein Niako_6441 [Niastella koreensis GR20-10]OQP55015.1 hypothetical protein A4D02_01460 [Niastella koreensis]